MLNIPDHEAIGSLIYAPLGLAVQTPTFFQKHRNCVLRSRETGFWYIKGTRELLCTLIVHIRHECHDKGGAILQYQIRLAKFGILAYVQAAMLFQEGM